jgi:hypothetical protein
MAQVAMQRWLVDNRNYEVSIPDIGWESTETPVDFPDQSPVSGSGRGEDRSSGC